MNKLRKFDELVSKYLTEDDLVIDKFKSGLAVGDYEETLNKALKIAQKRDDEYLYWKELEEYIHSEGGVKILLEWYDRLFKALDGKFLNDDRKDLLYKYHEVDTLEMIKDRYSLDDWNFRKEFIEYHE